MKKPLYLCLCALFALAMMATKARSQTITSHTEIPDSMCGGGWYSMNISGCISGLTVKTYWGDGTYNTTPVSCSGATGYIWVGHTYPASGTYTIKAILYSGTAAVDSLLFSHTYHYCRYLPVVNYLDANSNCLYDSGEGAYTPAVIKIDSTGYPIDTISALFGWGYMAYGPPGTVYTFTVLSAGGLTVSCPSTGVVTSTVPAPGTTAPVQYIGFVCGSTSAFDLAMFGSTGAAITGARASGWVSNASCIGTPANVKITFSPKYSFDYMSPSLPCTLSGNTITFNIGTVSAISPEYFYVRFNPVGTLSLGDTAQTKFEVTPTTGDANTANNTVIRVDTIRASFDPNQKSVTPTGNIAAGTKLQYMLEFENDGNDTAHNIYVMDTLSDNLDVNTINMISSTHRVNLIKYTYAGKTILKFDFPNIMLPDSSHHDYCRGAVAFSVNAKSTLMPGTTVANRVGIFFDINPVVMTNTVYSKIPLPSIVKKLSLTNVEVYPNPVNDVLTVNTDGSFNHLTITNTIGQVVVSQSVGANTAKVNVKALPSGIYHLTLKGDNGVKVQQFEKL